MLIRLRAAWESFRSNLFFVPLLLLLVGGALAQLMLWVDVRIEADGTVLPEIFRSTVDSARALLSTIATATITVAGIAFSVSLLLFQLASSQYSPRVLHGLFRDTFTKRVLGLVVATFTYCLLVLRAVRGQIEEGGAPIVPNLSVIVALLLGILSILAIVAFINHTAHSMDATDLIRRITAETRAQVERLAEPPEESDGDPEPAAPQAPEGAFEVAASRDGWVQQIDDRGLLAATDEGSTIRVETFPGDFVPRGAVLCYVWPEPEDPRHATREVREAIHLGRTRTMQQDLAFGLRQLVDVALRALSPGINDPTTAGEVISHLGGILRDILVRDLPPGFRSDGRGRRLFYPYRVDHGRLVELAFEQIRQAGASQPAVVRRLLDTLGPLARHVEESGYADRAAMVRQQARKALQALATHQPLEDDLRVLEEHAEAQGLLA